jgi:hypothetical protein
MRNPALLPETLVVEACGTAPITRSESPAGKSIPGHPSFVHRTSSDTAVQFILNPAIAGFHLHDPALIARFLDTYAGCVSKINGGVQ